MIAIGDVEDAIRHGRSVIGDYWYSVSGNEISTRYTIIDPIIRVLGWESIDPNQCVFEYQRGQQGKVDYALRNRDGKLLILVEAKRFGTKLESFERQLAGYARGIQYGVGVLTDGARWQSVLLK